MNGKKTKINLYSCALIACVFVLAGCAEQEQYETVGKIYVGGTRKLQAMEAAEDVLARMHFTIEKADAETGFIRTKPLPAAQLFEFWRSDNVGSFNSSEANLHSIRRIAEVNMSREGEKLRIDCDVRTQRLSLPEKQITSSTRAYGMFSKSSPSMQRLKLNRQQEVDATWIDLGRDERLATEILMRIKESMEWQ